MCERGGEGERAPGAGSGAWAAWNLHSMISRCMHGVPGAELTSLLGSLTLAPPLEPLAEPCTCAHVNSSPALQLHDRLAACLSLAELLGKAGEAEAGGRGVGKVLEGKLQKAVARLAKLPDLAQVGRGV